MARTFNLKRSSLRWRAAFTIFRWRTSPRDCLDANAIRFSPILLRSGVQVSDVFLPGPSGPAGFLDPESAFVGLDGGIETEVGSCRNRSGAVASSNDFAGDIFSRAIRDRGKKSACLWRTASNRNARLRKQFWLVKKTSWESENNLTRISAREPLGTRNLWCDSQLWLCPQRPR